MRKIWPVETNFYYPLADAREIVEFQLKILLRARPASVLPLACQRSGADKGFWLRAPAGAVSLRKLIAGSSRHPAEGEAILYGLLTAFCDASERLLLVEPRLFCPERIFRLADGFFSFVSLPLTAASCERYRQASSDAFFPNLLGQWDFHAAFREKAVKQLERRQYRPVLEEIHLKRSKRSGAISARKTKPRQEMAKLCLSHPSQEKKARQSKKLWQAVASSCLTKESGQALKSEVGAACRSFLRRCFSAADFSLGRTTPLPPVVGGGVYAVLREVARKGGDKKMRSAYILDEEFVLGRDPALVDFVLEHPSCGRQHARMTRHGESYFLEDLGSRNGSRLNGKRLRAGEAVLLPEVCRLEFSKLEFDFHIFEGRLTQPSLKSDYFVPKSRSPASPRPGTM